jgi:hypothetical protein
MVEVMKVFCYFSGSPEDVGIAGLDVGYALCSLEVGAVF